MSDVERMIQLVGNSGVGAFVPRVLGSNDYILGALKVGLISRA